jgi:SLOG cluster2
LEIVRPRRSPGTYRTNGRSLNRRCARISAFSAALRTHQPVYLIGAFGGCAEAVIAALYGRKPAALTLDYQAADPIARDTIRLYNAQHTSSEEPIDYPLLTAEFETAGIAGLSNGLDSDENERLFNTADLPEMIALVLRGISRLGRSPLS